VFEQVPGVTGVQLASDFLSVTLAEHRARLAAPGVGRAAHIDGEREPDL
jgi:hypothetical protein